MQPETCQNFETKSDFLCPQEVQLLVSILVAVWQILTSVFLQMLLS